MAKIIRRVWTTQGPTGKRVRHVAYGYTLMVDGTDEKRTREKRFSSAWQTEADALTALSQRLKEIEAGQLTRPADRTLGELAGKYLKYKGDQGKRSLADDERIIKRRLLVAFGAGLFVRKLTAEAIAGYEAERIGQVSAYTVSNELSVLRHMLQLARKWGYLESVPEIEMPKKPEGRLRYLEEEEIARLLAACRQSGNPYLAVAVVVAVGTGMRKGEILGLEWERVDLSSARITLYTTKGKKPRGVPINGDVYDALMAYEPDPAHRHGRLFPAGCGRRASQVRKAFKVACRRAGIAGFRFHDLRHTAASHMVMRGATLQEVKEILGHSDLRMTLRYAHLSPAHLRAAVNRLEGLGRVPMAHKMAQSVRTGEPAQADASQPRVNA